MTRVSSAGGADAFSGRYGDACGAPRAQGVPHVAEVLDLLGSARARIVETRNERSAPGLGVLHRLLYHSEAIVSSLLDCDGEGCKQQGFIESQYSNSGTLDGGLACSGGACERPADGIDDVDGMDVVSLTRSFLENMRDAAVEIDGVVARLQRQSHVERFLSIEENLELLKAATADLLYSMATFEPLTKVEGESSLPVDVVEDYRALMGRLEEVAYIASVDVVASVQDVLIEVVMNFAGSDGGSVGQGGRGGHGAVDGMVVALTGDVTKGWLVNEASKLYEAACVQRKNGVYSMYILFTLVAGALLEGDVGKGYEVVDAVGREIEDIRRMWVSVGSIEREGAGRLEQMGACERSVALLVYGVTSFQFDPSGGTGAMDQVSSKLSMLSRSLEYATGPLTRSMLLLAMGKLFSKADVRSALSHEKLIGYLMGISRWMDSPAANVRHACASALAACLGGPVSKGDTEEAIKMKQAAHAAGIGKRLIRQLSRQQDVLGHRATLAALTALLTDDIAGDLARAPDANPLAAVFSIMTSYLDSPRKGAEDVIRHATRFVHGMVSKSPLARYKALLAGGITPLERVLSTKSGAYGRNFALLSLWQLSKVSSLAADAYGWSSDGVVSLLNVLVEDKASPAAHAAAIFTLKHILCRNDTTFETVAVTDEMLKALVGAMMSSESEGVRTAAAHVLERLVDGGGDSSPRMVDSIDRFKQQVCYC